jgi:hypothetical protein
MNSGDYLKTLQFSCTDSRTQICRHRRFGLVEVDGLPGQNRHRRAFHSAQQDRGDAYIMNRPTKAYDQRGQNLILEDM